MTDEAGELIERDAHGDDDGFIYFTLSGDRYNAPGMPAESVVEVQRLSELIYQVARGVWLQQNQDRQRAPSELVRALDLRLVSIEEGSARPVLRLAQSRSADLEEEDFSPVIARARDTIINTITSVGDSRTLPDSFPRSALPSLRRLGKSLQPGEKITLGEPRLSRLPGEPEPTRAVLDQSVHAVIQEIDAALVNDPGPVELIGVVTEFDGYRGTFQLRDLNDRTHVCTLAYHEPQVAQAVKDALAPDGVTAPDVRVAGIGVHDSREQIGDLWDVDTVAIVRPYFEKALMIRLSNIEDLADGWWGPGSVAPDREAVTHVTGLLSDLARVDCPLAIGANASGAVVLEWARGAVEYTALVEPSNEMFLCADDTETDELQERQLEFDGPRLVRFVESGQIDD